jgi:hypothetical protein
MQNLGIPKELFVATVDEKLKFMHKIYPHDFLRPEQSTYRTMLLQKTLEIPLHLRHSYCVYEGKRTHNMNLDEWGACYKQVYEKVCPEGREIFDIWIEEPVVEPNLTYVGTLH